MRSIFLFVFIGILFYCSEKNVFKKLKQRGSGEVTVEGTDDASIMMGILVITLILGGGIVGYFVLSDDNTKWKCDSTSKQCKSDPTGTHDTKDKCEAAEAVCKSTATQKWKCDPTSKQCSQKPDGTHDTKDKCEAVCKKDPKKDQKKGCDTFKCDTAKHLKKKTGNTTCAATCKVTECCDCTSKDYKIDSTKQKCEKDQDKYTCNPQKKCEKSTDANAMSKSECEANCQGWKCDSSKQCKKGPNGKYATKSECEAKESICHNELYKITALTDGYVGKYPTNSDHYHPSILATYGTNRVRNTDADCGTHWNGTGVPTQKCAICCKKDDAKGTDPSTPDDYPVWCKQNKAFSSKQPSWENCAAKP